MYKIDRSGGPGGGSKNRILGQTQMTKTTQKKFMTRILSLRRIYSFVKWRIPSSWNNARPCMIKFGESL